MGPCLKSLKSESVSGLENDKKNWRETGACILKMAENVQVHNSDLITIGISYFLDGFLRMQNQLVIFEVT